MSIVENVEQAFTLARVQPSKVGGRFFDTNKVTFIFGESCCGQKKNGPQTAPPLVVDDNFIALIQQAGWEVDVVRVKQVFEPTPEASHCYVPRTVAATCSKIADASHKAAAARSFPLMVGGDHCLSMGSVVASAQRYPDLCLIWFDAHADINVPETSPSGNMHGMPLSAILGLDGMRQAPGFSEGQFTCLKPENIAYIGLRDVDEGEVETIARLGIKAAYNMEDLQRHGIAKLTEMAMDAVNPGRDRPMHISFDVDGMDPMDAPSTGTAVPGGVRLHEALEMIRTVRDTGLLASFDCVEVNPALGTPRDVEVTVENARWVIASALGYAVSSEEAKDDDDDAKKKRQQDDDDDEE